MKSIKKFTAEVNKRLNGDGEFPVAVSEEAMEFYFANGWTPKDVCVFMADEAEAELAGEAAANR